MSFMCMLLRQFVVLQRHFLYLKHTVVRETSRTPSLTGVVAGIWRLSLTGTVIVSSTGMPAAPPVNESGDQLLLVRFHRIFLHEIPFNMDIVNEFDVYFLNEYPKYDKASRNENTNDLCS